MPTLAQLKESLGNQPVTGYAAPKQNILQKVGGFAANVGKAIVSPVARAGVQLFNVGAGLGAAATGNMGAANAALDQPRNLPLLGETKPTLTNSSKPGLAQGLDVAGQGIQLGADVLGGEGGFGSGVINTAKTGATIGATQGFGNALTQTEGKSVGQNIGNIAGQTAIGAATGGVIGGATAAIHPIFQRSTPIMDPATVASPYDVGAATANRESAATGGVNAINQMNQTVGADQTALGNEFKQGAANIEKTNPGATLNLTGRQLDALNLLKESKLFSLPENLDNSGSGANIGGSEFKIGNAKIASQLEGVQNQTASSLTPTQAQDLVTRLNKLTFASKASGDLAVNQQTIGLTNEIKSAASKAFGPEWDKTYSNFAQGRAVMEKLDGIVNLDPKATPMDFNKQLGTIQTLGKTPEGQKFLQQAVDSYKAERGIDLTDPVAAVNHILKAQGQLEIAQKGSYGTQLMQALKSPNLAARRVAMIGTTLLGLAAAGTAFRKQIGNFIAGQ